MSQGGNLSRSMMEISNPTTMQLESGREEEPSADALYGPGRNANVSSRMDSLLHVQTFLTVKFECMYTSAQCTLHTVVMNDL